jgi:RNA polymerase sigma-70 factor (sigma-E family)
LGDADRATFEAWAEKQYPSLLRSAFIVTGDVHRAEDFVQEACIKVAARWEQLRDGNPEAYARRIVYRDHISWWRRTKEAPTDSPRNDLTTDPSEGNLDALVIRQSLDRLTRKQRAVLVLRFFEDLTEAQTAEALGISIGTVKSQTFAALAKLRQVAPELSQFSQDGGEFHG